VRAFLVILALAIAAPWAGARAAGSPAPRQWHAVLIAGDDAEPAFDNAVSAMADRLAAFGVPRRQMALLSSSGRQGRPATAENIRRAFAGLSPGAGEGCFVFVTSHGAPREGLVLTRAKAMLSPDTLAGLLDAACGRHPTVVIASGCFSGSFAEGDAMPLATRIVLTAARDDRPSFGCNASQRYTVFDRCVLESLKPGLLWAEVMRRARRCVTAAEQALGVDRPSSPQLSVGTAVAGLAVFSAAAPSVIDSGADGSVMDDGDGGDSATAPRLERPSRSH
jgi:hypothetical protein